MERIEDVEKARAMAYGEKIPRDAIQRKKEEGTLTDERKKELEELAERRGEQFGAEYDKRKEEEKRQEEEQKEREKKAQEKKEQELKELREGTIENFPASQIEAAGQRLIAVLRDRESQRLSPLIEDGDIGRFAAVIGELEEAVRANKPELLLQQLQSIYSAVDGISRARQSRVFSEDTESLTRVIHALDNFSGVCSEARLASKLPPSISRSVGRIGELTRSKWHAVIKRRDLMNEYERRRY